MTKLLNLLQKHSYTLSVHKTVAGCKIRSPARLMGNVQIEAHTLNYEVKPAARIRGLETKESPHVDVFLSIDDAFSSPARMPDYSYRPYIYYQLLKFANLLEYSPQLISYYSESDEFIGLAKQVEFNRIVKPPKTRKACELERKLYGFFKESLNSDFPEGDLELAEEYGIDDGYLILFKLVTGAE